MPYIPHRSRLVWKEWIDAGPPLKSATSGEINYVISRLVWRWVAEAGLSYGSMQNVIGVLECAKLEFYRRVLSPYEDTKSRENGDVYTEKEAV